MVVLLHIPVDGCDQMTCFGQRNVSTSGMGNLKSSEQLSPLFFPLQPQQPAMFPTIAIPSVWILEEGWCEEKLLAKPEHHVPWARNKPHDFKPQRFGHHLAHSDWYNHSSTFSGITYPQLDEAVLCSTTEIHAKGFPVHRPNNAVEDRKSCQIPQNSLKTFQTNEVLLWPSYTSLRTSITLPSINLSKLYIYFDQKLLNFWLATCNSTEEKTIK